MNQANKKYVFEPAPTQPPRTGWYEQSGGKDVRIRLNATAETQGAPEIAAHKTDTKHTHA